MALYIGANIGGQWNEISSSKVLQSSSWFITLRGNPDMDKDRIKGSAQHAKGTVKEVAGKAGDAKLEGEGKADEAAGKIRNAFGGLKGTLRGK